MEISESDLLPLSSVRGNIKELIINTSNRFNYELFFFVNKANLVHNLFLVYLSISACLGQLWTYHQEEHLCLCDTLYLLLCVDDCLVYRVE